MSLARPVVGVATSRPRPDGVRIFRSSVPQASLWFPSSSIQFSGSVTFVAATGVSATGGDFYSRSGTSSSLFYLTFRVALSGDAETCGLNFSTTALAVAATLSGHLSRASKKRRLRRFVFSGLPVAGALEGRRGLTPSLFPVKSRAKVFSRSGERRDRGLVAAATGGTGLVPSLPRVNPVLRGSVA